MDDLIPVAWYYHFPYHPSRYHCRLPLEAKESVCFSFVIFLTLPSSISVTRCCQSFRLSRHPPMASCFAFVVALTVPSLTSATGCCQSLHPSRHLPMANWFAFVVALTVSANASHLEECRLFYQANNTIRIGRIEEEIRGSCKEIWFVSNSLCFVFGSDSLVSLFLVFITCRLFFLFRAVDPFSNPLLDVFCITKTLKIVMPSCTYLYIYAWVILTQIWPEKIEWNLVIDALVYLVALMKGILYRSWRLERCRLPGSVLSLKQALL